MSPSFQKLVGFQLPFLQHMETYWSCYHPQRAYRYNTIIPHPIILVTTNKMEYRTIETQAILSYFQPIHLISKTLLVQNRQGESRNNSKLGSNKKYNIWVDDDGSKCMATTYPKRVAPIIIIESVSLLNTYNWLWWYPILELNHPSRMVVWFFSPYASTGRTGDFKIYNTCLKSSIIY